MSRLFSAGGEESDVRAVWSAVDSVLAGATSSPVQAFGYNEIIDYAPRTGRGMYILDQSQFLRNDFGSETTRTELYFGFAVRFPEIVTNNLAFFTIFTDTVGAYIDNLNLRTNLNGSVSLFRTGTSIATSAVGVVVSNQWYYFEVWAKPLNSSGRFLLKIDGVTVIDFTGDTTDDREYINAYQIQGNLTSSVKSGVAFDDFVVNDPNGSYNNTYPGMVRLLPIRAQAAGTYSEWSRAGVNLGYDAAQARNGTFEFTMMQTSSADKKETFIPELPDLPAGAVITNIILSQRARTEAGAGVIAPMLISNSTESISADQTLVSTWKNYQYAWHHNPYDSADWEEADLATLEIGYSS